MTSIMKIFCCFFVMTNFNLVLGYSSQFQAIDLQPQLILGSLFHDIAIFRYQVQMNWTDINRFPASQIPSHTYLS